VRTRILCTSAIAALAAALIWPASAGAHATLLKTSPPSGTDVPTAPHRLVLTFDQQVRPVAGGTDVLDDAGHSVTAGAATNAPSNSKQLVIPLQPNLPDGDYTVHWSIVSTDGHLISGIYAIGVGTNRPPPQASSQSSPIDWPYLIARFFYFTGLLVLVGGVVFRVAAHQPGAAAVSGEPRRMMGLRERHRANQVLALSAVMVLAGGWVALTRQGAQVAGVSFWEAFDHRGPVASALQATRFGREFGRGIDVTAVFTILVALAYAAVPFSRRLTAALAIPAAAAGVWALAAPGISGHAGDPGHGPLVVAVDTAHTAAAAVWIGGLVQLLLVTPHATRGLPDGQRAQVRAAIARRFSRIAIVAVAVLAVSGGLRALWEMSAVSQLWTTSYGQVLVAKTVLFAVTLAVASRSRVLVERFPRLRRTMSAELVTLAVVVGAVALLTNLPPGNIPSAEAAIPAGGPAVVQAAGGARVSVWPGRAGTNAIGVSLPAGAGKPDITLTTGGSRVTPSVEPLGGGAWLAWAPGLDPGVARAVIGAGGRTWSANLDIGQAIRSGGVPPTPLDHGAVAADEAAGFAVGAQRIGAHRARFTVLSADGSSPRAIAVVSNGGLAAPCTGTPEVCWEAPVAPGTTHLAVALLGPKGVLGRGRLTLPAAGSAPALALVQQTARAYRGLHSLRIQNVIASDPTHSVATTFTVQSPDRLVIDVHGGVQSRIIGTTRWDLQNGSWVKSAIPRLVVPDPFWAPGARAAYVQSSSRHDVMVTLVVPTGPTFFRILVDRRTHIVTRLWMITAAHFMHESHIDLNHAPPVRPPAVDSGA
jgi:copper transport protein